MHTVRSTSFLQALHGHAWPCSTIRCGADGSSKRCTRALESWLRAVWLATAAAAVHTGISTQCACAVLESQMAFSTQGWRVSGRVLGSLVALVSGGNDTVAESYGCEHLLTHWLADCTMLARARYSHRPLRYMNSRIERTLRLACWSVIPVGVECH